MVPTFGEELLTYDDGLIPNDVTAKIRVENKYTKEQLGQVKMTELISTYFHSKEYRLMK